MRTEPQGPQIVQLDFANKFNYLTLAVSALTGLWAFYVQFKQTMTRGETFGRNFNVIEHQFGAEHREAFGEDKKLSKYGYPDMGNNIYSDLLPYKDWITINNAQRCHENFIT